MALRGMWEGVLDWWIVHFYDSHHIYSGKGEGSDQIEHAIACHKEIHGRPPAAVLFPPGRLEHVSVREVCGVPLRESEEVPQLHFRLTDEV